MIQTISIQVIGKVQGVFFRQSTHDKAVQLGITGWVQNQPDGSVYITATGEPEQLDELLAWCRQGPPKAQVVKVQVQQFPPELFDGFYIRRY
jgi:acylphosphatase